MSPASHQIPKIQQELELVYRSEQRVSDTHAAIELSEQSLRKSRDLIARSYDRIRASGAFGTQHPTVSQSNKGP